MKNQNWRWFECEEICKIFNEWSRINLVLILDILNVVRKTEMKKLYNSRLLSD